MNDRQLQTFIEVAEYKSFSKVARKNGVSTTAVIKQISTLEKNIGLSLLHRAHRGMKLTPAGEDFLETAKKIMNIYKQGLRSASCKSMNQSLVLVVCEIESMRIPLEDFAIDYQIDHPHMNIQVIRENQLSEYNIGDNQKLETIYVGTKSTDEEFREHFMPLFDDEFCLVLSNPAYRQRIATMSDTYNDYFPKLLHETSVYLRSHGYGETRYAAKRFIERNGGTCIQLDSDGDDYTLRQEMIRGNILMLPRSCCRMGVRNSLVLDSGISAGTIGFNLKKDASEDLEEFCSQFEKIRNQRT